MKFEDYESAWALQQPAAPAPAELAALRGQLQARLGQRRRLLIIGIVTSAIGLFVMQAVTIANLYHLRGGSPWVFAAHAVANQGINLALMFELVRSLIRHRRLARSRAESVREILQLSLRNVAEQIWDVRFSRWVLPALAATALFSAYLNNPVALAGWKPFLQRTGFILLAFSLITRLVWYHYRQHLRPEHDRLQATLAEMGERAET
jgi:hypothetical protein